MFSDMRGHRRFGHALKTLTKFFVVMFWSAFYASISPSVTYITHTHRHFRVLGTWVH